MVSLRLHTPPDRGTKKCFVRHGFQPSSLCQEHRHEACLNFETVLMALDREIVSCALAVNFVPAPLGGASTECTDQDEI